MSEFKKVDCIWDNLGPYDYLAKPDDFIEIKRWSNGEGYDISINDNIFSLSEGQLDAINYLIQKLRYEKLDDKDS